MRNAADAAQEIIAGGLTGAELTAFLRRFQADALGWVLELIGEEAAGEAGKDRVLANIIRMRQAALKPATPPPPKP